VPTARKPLAAAAVARYSNDQIVSAATGRWGEVAHEVKPADPYPIARPEGDPIVITPLTRRRRKKLKAAQASYLMVGAQLAEVQNDQKADQSTITRIQTLMEEAEYAYDSALFGDVVDEVYGFFDDLDEAFWDSMYSDIHDKLVNRADVPEDICAKCGQKLEKDDEAKEGEPGKGES
jgi:hypothetical protein